MMHPTRSLVARALFQEWARVRGRRLGGAMRPFSRAWEALLDEAGLHSAVERGDAGREVRALAAEGWLEMRTGHLRPELLVRVVIPLAAEPRWAEAFGFVAPSGDEAGRVREYPWVPELRFLAEARVNVPLADLERLQKFLAGDGRQRPVVPIKERSLQLFGDEKRLDELVDSALFQPGRLELREHLRCELVGVPLGWRRGPATATGGGGAVLVVENAATWHTFARWNAEAGHYGAIVYGDGNRFVEGVGFLAEILGELGGVRPVRYFGDLDLPGLKIPWRASARAEAAGLPAIEPESWCYRELFRAGSGAEQVDEVLGGESGDGGESGRLGEEELAWCDWLGELREPARALLASGRRLAQEHVGWEWLQRPGFRPGAR